ncbi:hypothetical protein CRUP_016070 [Coryphaenoides rupestris]|nr:hypothetical protein CRUP_016070 [Coryphaenoides rupestris]
MEDESSPLRMLSLKLGRPFRRESGDNVETTNGGGGSLARKDASARSSTPWRAWIKVTRGQHRHRQYHYVSEKKNWTEAQAHCKDRFSDLATITDCQENKDAFDTIKEKTNVWIENAPMILITENRTWEEAVEHCRAEYHDLVSAQSTEALDWVRDVSRNAATTPTVWVGLHYTCVLDFWFWVDNAEAYDDGGGSRWADGQRGHGADCGASGAVNISSRLWLSQPSSVKLNFICSLCDKMQT